MEKEKNNNPMTEKKKRKNTFVDVDIFDPNAQTRPKKRITELPNGDRITTPGSGAYSNGIVFSSNSNYETPLPSINAMGDAWQPAAPPVASSTWHPASNAQVQTQQSAYGLNTWTGKNKSKVVLKAGGETWEDPSLADWDSEDFRIFCGDLGNEVNDEHLRAAFMRFGHVQRVRVVRDKKNRKITWVWFRFIRFSSRWSKSLKRNEWKIYW